MKYEKTVIRGGTLVFSHGTEEADIWIEGGKIRRISQDTLEKREGPRAVQEIDARGMYVLPGFVTTSWTSFYSGQNRRDYLRQMRDLVRAGCTTLVDVIFPERWMDKSQLLYQQTVHYNSLIDYLWHIRLECSRFTPREVHHWCRQGYRALHISVCHKDEISTVDWETIANLLTSYNANLVLHLPDYARLDKTEREEIRLRWLDATRHWRVRTVLPGLVPSVDDREGDPFFHLFWLGEGQTDIGLRLLHSRWYDLCPIAARIQDVRVDYRRKWCTEEELLCLLVRLAAKNAAKTVGLYPQKGALAPGSDADIVFLKKENWLTKIDLSTILNFSDLLLPTSVMSNGKWIYRDMRFTPTIGMGRCLRDTKPYSFVI